MKKRHKPELTDYWAILTAFSRAMLSHNNTSESGNCGTGAGGFQLGNSCHGARASEDTSIEKPARDVILGQSETSRQTISVTGDQGRVFVDATQKPTETNWLYPEPRKSVEATFDLNQSAGTVYFNRIDALVTRKGYANEVASHMMKEFAKAGYHTMTAYVQYSDQDSQSMMKKLGGKPGKETSHGRYWSFDLTGAV